jgi:hypothetical protein
MFGYKNSPQLGGCFMTHVCLCTAGFGIIFSALLYAAIKLRWQMAERLSRNAPRIVTVVAAVLLLVFAMLTTAGTTDLFEVFGKGLKEAEYALRDWFSSLKFRSN